ncbi:MAG TPA: DUF971 domain-containing protein [Ignavibacteriaceae bacterium]|nr:DUF971 domain-containing protein [Ignavibacteriaceae bacterium]
MIPVQIKIVDKKILFIKWKDESESTIDLIKLRRLCPCATCLTERERQSKSYIPLLNENQLKVTNINQVGSYAIGISWKDGHNTGIYEYPFLKKLADEK